MSATVLSLNTELKTRAPSDEHSTPVSDIHALNTVNPTQHSYFDDRPSWDTFGLTFSTIVDHTGNEIIVSAQGLVLPNKVNLRQKTQGHLFPIELGGLQTDRNILSDWLGPNYAIPLRALASRTMALQPTFNHSGWHQQRTPKQGLMARFNVVRRDDFSIKHLHILAWAVDISSGNACEEIATEWEIPNRL